VGIHHGQHRILRSVEPSIRVNREVAGMRDTTTSRLGVITLYTSYSMCVGDREKVYDTRTILVYNTS